MSLDLCDAVGLPRTKASQRKLQLIIRELRHLNKPVLLTCEKPYGYFWPGNREEGERCLASLRSRAKEDFITRRDIKVGLGLYWAQAEKMKLF